MRAYKFFYYRFIFFTTDARMINLNDNRKVCTKYRIYKNRQFEPVENLLINNFSIACLELAERLHCVALLEATFYIQY